jgi:hypothetical protein
MLGIGAAQSKDPNGIAWKQNRDFENLLKRLNEANTIDEEDTPSKVEDDGEHIGEEGRKSGTEKKRKRDDETDGKAEKKARKIRRKETEEINSKTSKQVPTVDVTKQTKVTENDGTPSEAAPTPAYIPRHRAYVLHHYPLLELIIWVQTSSKGHCIQKHGVEVNSSDVRDLGNCSYSESLYDIGFRYTIQYPHFAGRGTHSREIDHLCEKCS